MARRRLLLTDILSVAIGAIARLVELRQLSLDRDGFRISRQLAVAMARRAGIDRHVGRKAAQSACPRNINMASRTFQDVLTFAAFVRELCRDTFRRIGSDKCFGGFMTAGTIRADGRLRLPMAFETSIVRPRHRLERTEQRRVGIEWRHCRDNA